MSPRLKLCGMQATITAEKKGCNTKRFFVTVSLLLLYQKLGFVDSVQHS
jgi:hypothetical protein